MLRYSTLALGDVYAVIGYYLRHPEDIDAYLSERERQAEEVRERIERQQGDLSVAPRMPKTPIR